MNRRAVKRVKQTRSKPIREVLVIHECLALAVGAIDEAVDSVLAAALSGDCSRRREHALGALRLLRNAQSIVQGEMGGTL